MIDRNHSTPRRCATCGGDHADEAHADPDVAASELARACRELRVDDVSPLAAQCDLLEARAWLRSRGFSPRACIELDVERRRRAA